MTAPALRLATWNLHRGRGRDGRIDPGRTLAALLGTPQLAGVDILALTEAEVEAPPYAGFLDLGALQAATGLRSVHDRPDLRHGPQSHGMAGNLLLLRPPLVPTRVFALRLGGLYPRTAVVADLPGLRVVATHLSLAQPLRLWQLRRIAAALAPLPSETTVLMGDLNEWRPWGGLALSRLCGLGLFGAAPATFPAARPVLPLDRILCTVPDALAETRARSAPALAAVSDHLPLTALLRLRPSAATSG